jgi:hypothetical protein
MAKVAPWQYTTDVDTFHCTFESVDYGIGGKLICASKEVDYQQALEFYSDADYKRLLKLEMATELARFMIENNLIEFTRLTDHDTMMDKIFARCYLAPDDQVRLLRLHKNG